MADKKISELDAITGANTAATDVFVVVDTSTGQTKKITREELNNAIEQDVLSSIDIDTINGDFTVNGNINLGDNDKAIFGAGSDLQIYHDGSNSIVKDNGTGNLELQGSSWTVVKGATSGTWGIAHLDGAQTNLYHNGSLKLATTSTGIDVTGNATFGDNNKAIFGAGSDLQIYHTGTDSVIQDAGQGDLYVKASNNLWFQGNTSNDIMARFQDNGAVTLYYDNAAKLATTSTGIDVTGTVTADKLTLNSNSYAAPLLSVSNESTGGYGAYINTFGFASSHYALRVDRNNGKQALRVDGIGDISFYEDTGTTAKLFWDASAESLGIGTTSPQGFLEIVGSTSSAATSGGTLIVRQDGDANTDGIALTSSNAISHRIWKDSSGRLNIGSSSYPSSLVQDVSGNLGIGTSSPTNSITTTGALEFTGNAFNGSGTGIWSPATNELGLVTSGSTQVRITSTGLVGIGTASPQGALHIVNAGLATQLRVSNTTTDATTKYGTVLGSHYTNSEEPIAGMLLTSSSSSTGGSVSIGGGISSANAVNTIKFYTAANNTTLTGTERARLDVSGNLLVGTTSSIGAGDEGVQLTNNGQILTAKNSVNSRNHISFVNPNGVVGNISTSGTTTTYGTSSDYRLKENIADADDAGSKVDAIQVRQFDWKADGSHQDYGMIAQELQAVAPEAVSGDADSEEMMGVDYSKLVPMLIKEIQSLRNRVSKLEGN